ncbi:hypothetical protein M3Y99_01836200 [Aphelenchoides fujianensis]|nr:hypothetical protein M3Y99_01836200 [Aphelenchoides fujianensis]
MDVDTQDSGFPHWSCAETLNEFPAENVMRPRSLLQVGQTAASLAHNQLQLPAHLPVGLKASPLVSADIDANSLDSWSSGSGQESTDRFTLIPWSAQTAGDRVQNEANGWPPNRCVTSDGHTHLPSSEWSQSLQPLQQQHSQGNSHEMQHFTIAELLANANHSVAFSPSHFVSADLRPSPLTPLNINYMAFATLPQASSSHFDRLAAPLPIVAKIEMSYPGASPPANLSEVLHLASVYHQHSCRYCGMILFREMQKHEVAHHSNAAFPCSVCGVRMTQSGGRTTHQQTFHKLRRPWGLGNRTGDGDVRLSAEERAWRLHLHLPEMLAEAHGRQACVEARANRLMAHAWPRERAPIHAPSADYRPRNSTSWTPLVAEQPARIPDAAQSAALVSQISSLFGKRTARIEREDESANVKKKVKRQAGS